MRHRIALACALTAVALAAFPAGAAPIGPVLNGEFELAAPQAVKDATCAAFGDTRVDVLPQGSDNPLPVALPWLTSVVPCEQGALKAVQWSSSRVTQFGDIDGDGDREASIDGSRPVPPGDPVGRNHNLWQAFPNPHQAYTGDFEALRFRVEAGSIPAGAIARISFSTVPLSGVHPFVGVFVECNLVLRSLTPVGGLVSSNPAAGSLSSAYSACDGEAAAWAGADEAGRRAILAKLRIVQLSFWGFETGAPVVVDGVELAGAKTILGV